MDRERHDPLQGRGVCLDAARGSAPTGVGGSACAKPKTRATCAARPDPTAARERADGVSLRATREHCGDPGVRERPDAARGLLPLPDLLMDELILVRHAESEYSVRGLLNGDPRVAVALTDEGREQARRLGEALAQTEIDLCATSEFARTIETAEIALAGRDIAHLVVPELNDHPAGDYEGK